jgi:hypothetical protein
LGGQERLWFEHGTTKRIIVGRGQVAGSILATESDGSPAGVGEADVLLTGVETAGVADTAVVVEVERVLQGEDRLQAITEGFFTAETKAGASQQAGIDAAEGVGARNRDVTHPAGVGAAAHGKARKSKLRCRGIGSRGFSGR